MARSTTISNRNQTLPRTRGGVRRPIAWIRNMPGATTLPSQQALDAIASSPEFPHY